jgi:hypothetical protein
MARGEVFIEDERGSIRAWRTDLTGHGNVRIGEEFTVRELGQFGCGGLVKCGRKLRVRVVSIDAKGRSFNVLKVKILQDMTPCPLQQDTLFT